MKQRDQRIDALRAIAILLIVVAHTFPGIPRTGNWVYSVREFDVPAMAFLLGASFVASRARHPEGVQYGAYVLNRFKRLVIPAWVFATLVFLCFAAFAVLLHKSFPFSIAKIIGTYDLLSGIGYVWIIRVFFVIALCAPLLWRAINALHQPGVAIVVFGVLIGGQSLAVAYLVPANAAPGVHYGPLEYLLECTGFLIIALIGGWVMQHPSISAWVLAALGLACALGLWLNAGRPNLEVAKYPPHALYLTYGVGMSLLLFQIFGLAPVQRVLRQFQSPLGWLSRHSLELYYWHVVVLLLINPTRFPGHWVALTVVTLAVSLPVTYVQTRFVPRFFTLGLR